jgi:hypothetical protein
MIMTELKNKWISTFILLLVLTAAFTSCKKDNNNEVQNADYVGTWSSGSDDSSTSQNGNIQILTLTKNNFDAMVKTKNNQGQWVNSFALKGTMTVNGNKMNVHISQFGSSINPLTGEQTNTVTYFNEGSLIFETLMSSSGYKKDFQSEYSVVGNKLTLKTDMNDDGDYTDANETTTYTRQ